MHAGTVKIFFKFGDAVTNSNNTTIGLEAAPGGSLPAPVPEASL